MIQAAITKRLPVFAGGDEGVRFLPLSFRFHVPTTTCATIANAMLSVIRNDIFLRRVYFAIRRANFWKSHRYHANITKSNIHNISTVSKYFFIEFKRKFNSHFEKCIYRVGRKKSMSRKNHNKFRFLSHEINWQNNN